jgi:polyisoprenoid-binding protein YceI
VTVTTTEVLKRPGAVNRLWRVNPDYSTVEFRVRTFWGLKTVTGHFDRFEGYYLDRAEGAIIELAVEARTLDTGNARRDRHLRSADFFDVERYPQVRFSSTLITDLVGGLAVVGTLEAGGRSVELTLDATLRRDGDAAEIEATTTVDHRALGMTHSPLGMLRPPTTLHVKGRLEEDETA